MVDSDRYVTPDDLAMMCASEAELLALVTEAEVLAAMALTADDLVSMFGLPASSDVVTGVGTATATGVATGVSQPCAGQLRRMANRARQRRWRERQDDGVAGLPRHRERRTADRAGALGVAFGPRRHGSAQGQPSAFRRAGRGGGGRQAKKANALAG